MTTLKKTARIAGLLYLILTITALYSYFYVSSQIRVPGDEVATANKILSNEFLYRTGIISDLISLVTFLFLVLVLYRLFKPVDEHLAKIMVVLVIVLVTISIFVEVFKIASFMTLKGEVLKALQPEQLQNLAIVFHKIAGYGVSVNTVFIGLWLIPFGQLVYKSKFIPRIFGIFLIINGIAYISDSFIFILFPDYRAFVSHYTIIFESIGEPLIILWLLIKGVKTRW
jgi:hypothetical protein